MKLEQIIKMINNGTCPNGELIIRDSSDFYLHEEDLSKILNALKQPNNIRKVFLEPYLSASGIQEVAKFLEDNTQIESFDLWNRPYRCEKENDNIGYFVPVIQKNKTLKHLVLSEIGVNGSDTAPFFEALKANKHLEFLSLYNNKFEDLNVARQIADMISTNTTLKSLKIDGHWFDQEALGIIAGSLASNTTLEDLDVSGWRVKDAGAILFANALAENINLKSIRFFNSEIKAPGTIALAISLLTNTHLTKLDLGCDSITLEGTLALAAALEVNSVLKKLSIGVYAANNEGVKAFADMLEKNTSLVKFDYDSFSTSGDGMDKLRIDMGLTRNKIALLKSQECQKDGGQELQKAVKNLETLKYKYEQKIVPPNQTDYLKMRLQAMDAGLRSGCCAFPFFSATKSTAPETAPEKVTVSKP